MDNQPLYSTTPSQYQPVQNKRLRSAMVVVGVLVVIFIGFYGWQYIANRGKTSLTIKKLPSNAVITMNGEKVRSGKVYLQPGTYKLKAESEGFATYERTVDITEGQAGVKAFFVLDPVSDQAISEVSKKTKDYIKLEGEAGKYYEDISDNNAATYPIMKELPYRGPLYSIEYYQSGGEFKLQIKSSDPLGRQVALERIREMGYEPSDYTIEYLDVKNPFVSEVN